MKKYLLWIDSISGGLSGVYSLAFGSFLVGIYGWPQDLFIFSAIVSLSYCLYGQLLIFRWVPRTFGVPLLALMNMCWGILCITKAYELHEVATGIGLFHLYFEAVYVFTLAVFELRLRKELL